MKRARKWRAVHVAFMSSLGMPSSQYLDLFPEPEALQTLLFRGFFSLHDSSCRHDGLLTQSLAPLPSRESGEWGWNFQASNQDLVFLATCPHPEAIWGPHQEYLIKTKNILASLSLRIFQKDLGALCQELEIKTKYIFLIMLHPPLD